MSSTMYYIIAGNCGVSKIFLQEGTIDNLTSAHYPYTYPSDLSCSWLVESSDERFRILVDIVEFRVERGYDFVIVEDIIDNKHQTRSTITRLTGVVGITKIVSSGDQMVIKFITDRTGGDKGFNLDLKVIGYNGKYFDLSLCVQTEHESKIKKTRKQTKHEHKPSTYKLIKSI